MQLDGAVAVVTGGGKGIGRGIARRFACEGAHVLVADIDGDAGAKVADSLVQLGPEGLFLHTDVGQKDQATAAVTTAVDTWGRIDVVVNNAIALSPNVVLEEKTDQMLEAVLRTGLWATWWTMRAAMPTMRDQGRGRIVNFYSIDAEAAAWLHGDYNVVKSAILGLTRSAAMEWAPFGITVNAIAPAARGTVFDELSRQVPGFEEAAAAMNPIGRVGDPEEDIAPVAVFLASEASRYVTGELIHVDGGQHLPRYNSKPQPN